MPSESIETEISTNNEFAKSSSNSSTVQKNWDRFQTTTNHPTNCILVSSDLDVTITPNTIPYNDKQRKFSNLSNLSCATSSLTSESSSLSNENTENSKYSQEMELNPATNDNNGWQVVKKFRKRKKKG